MGEGRVESRSPVPACGIAPRARRLTGMVLAPVAGPRQFRGFPVMSKSQQHIAQATNPAKESDFTGGGIFALPSWKRQSTGDDRLDEELREIAEKWSCPEDCNDLVVEMMITALKIGRDNTGMADLKLFNRSLKEMRRANRVFKSFRHVRKISVFGSARTTPDEVSFQRAEEFSRKMAQRDYMVITGAGEGIMGAAQLGAGRENSFGLNIRLPFEQSANETILGDSKLLMFNYFFTRKLSFMKESDAFALFPGGFGTMDEGFEALTLIQTGKAAIMPVVMIDDPGGGYWDHWAQFVQSGLMSRGLISPEDESLYFITEDLDEAVAHVMHFYRCFHSYRFVKGRTVFRLKKLLTPAAIDQLNTDFADLLAEGRLERSAALPEEANEESILHLPRLVGTLVNARFGRWRQLIDAINNAETVPVKM